MRTIFKLIKAYWRGFIGGPDFSLNTDHCFILEDKQLTLKVPSSNIVTGQSSKKVNLPHTSTRWFTKKAETERQHCYVHMMDENWMYVPPIALFPSSEYGLLGFELRIKQVRDINVLDKAALSHYVTQAYDDYHNSPDGINTEIRQRKEQEFSKSAYSWTREEIETEITMAIELNGRIPLAPAIIKKINQTDWVFYREIRNNRLSFIDYYCLPLSEHSFLEVEFRHRVDRSNKHKKWEKSALKSQEKIMASIYLDDIAFTQDPLIK